MLPGDTVAAAYFSNYLKVHLRQAIRKKRPDLKDPLILHDNAAVHRALMTQETIRLWGWKTLPQPPYSPDLSPPDFDLFWKLKEPLRDQRFHHTDDVKSAANHVLRNLNSTGVLTCTMKLPHR